MAIKLKSIVTVPEALNKLADIGFTYSTLEKHFKELAKVKRDDVKEYLKNNEDGFDLTEKTVACTNGKITLTERSSYSYDLDSIQELIDSGHVTLTTILQCVNFRSKDLQTALGAKSFQNVAEVTSSEPTLSFKPNTDFKADILLKAAVVDELNQGEINGIVQEKVKPIKKKVDSLPKVESQLATKKKTAKTKAVNLSLDESIKLAQAVNKKSNKSNSVQDDLDSILGE